MEMRDNAYTGTVKDLLYTSRIYVKNENGFERTFKKNYKYNNFHLKTAHLIEILSWTKSCKKPR